MKSNNIEKAITNGFLKTEVKKTFFVIIFNKTKKITAKERYKNLIDNVGSAQENEKTKGIAAIKICNKNFIKN